jgi:pre-mRNA-processing factor 40
METSPWREFTAPDGRKYWHDATTHVSTWEIPEDYRVLLERAKSEQEAFDKTAANTEATTPVTAVDPNSRRPSVAEHQRDIVFTTFEEAEAAFINLLQESVRRVDNIIGSLISLECGLRLELGAVHARHYP